MFWYIFGSILGSRILQKGSPKRRAKKQTEQKTQKGEITLPLNENPCFLGPTWSQNASKMKANACQEASENNGGKFTKQ